MNPIDPSAEWLEADGLGGFASGTVSGIRTRRYHALLLTATTPPAGRMMLVNGFDAWVETPGGTFAISSQRYGPDVIHPDGASRIESFEHEPWPRWRYKINDDLIIEQELFGPKGQSAVFISWRLVRRHPERSEAESKDPGALPNSDSSGSLDFARDDSVVKLNVRPFLSGRDFHSTHHENSTFKFSAEQNGECLSFRSYDGVPAVIACSNGIIPTNQLGIEIFCTPKSSPVDLMPLKIWLRPGCFSFHFLKNRRC
jgi:glycogen debranching enzyme